MGGLGTSDARAGLNIPGSEAAVSCREGREGALRRGAPPPGSDLVCLIRHVYQLEPPKKGIEEKGIGVFIRSRSHRATGVSGPLALRPAR